MLNPKSNKKHKMPFPSDVAPEHKINYKSRESFSQSMMNYEVIRDKVQTDFQPKRIPEVADTKKPGDKKTLLNF